jgi:hypothetical protein
MAFSSDQLLQDLQSLVGEELKVGERYRNLLNLIRRY